MTLCSVAGCQDQFPRWRIQLKVWAKGMFKKHDPMEVKTPLVICDHHKTHPIHTPAEFFLPESREMITAAMRAKGYADPDFDTAEWDFVLIAGNLH